MEKRPVKLDFGLKKPRDSDRIVLCFCGKATDASLAQYNMLVGDRLKLEQAGMAKDETIIYLTEEVTALKTKLHGTGGQVIPAPMELQGRRRTDRL